MMFQDSENCRCKKCVPAPTPDPELLQKITESIEQIGLNSDIPESWKLVSREKLIVNK